MAISHFRPSISSSLLVGIIISVGFITQHAPMACVVCGGSWSWCGGRAGVICVLCDVRCGVGGGGVSCVSCVGQAQLPSARNPDLNSVSFRAEKARLTFF